MQDDTSSYYVLGYRSTNKAMDGHYRRITVRLNTRNDLKLDFRRGYYGPRDFTHFTKEDREKQLQDELYVPALDDRSAIYLDTAFFRLADDKYYVPVSIVVPGSAIPFIQNGDKDKATLDIIGTVIETSSKYPIGSIRDTVKLAVESQQAARRNIQYSSGFMLAPGTYNLKIVARENQHGTIGSFETPLTVPNLKKAPLKMSAVVLSTQRGPVGKQKQNPLAQGNTQLIPNLAHVFTPDQQLTFYYEVYDPAKDKRTDARSARSSPSEGGKKVHPPADEHPVLQRQSKTYETPLVETRELNAADRHAASFQLEVPLSKLRPGWYTCQINVVDDAGGTFLFPRMPVLIRAAPPTPHRHPSR